MKALTISQPYASLIAAGEKWVENRMWGTDYLGPLAIHAGKGTQYLEKQELTAYPTGQIIAVVDLVACVSLMVVRTGSGRSRSLERAGIDTIAFLNHEHTEGPYCWILQKVRRFPSGVWCRGKLGLWTVPLLAMRELEEKLLHAKESVASDDAREK